MPVTLGAGYGTLAVWDDRVRRPRRGRDTFPVHGGRQGISIDTFLLGDSFTLTELRFMAGYVVRLADRFNFVPELGVGHWDLDTTDLPSSFFGSVRGDIDDSGNDLIWRISGEWRVLARMHLYASYSEARYDFGGLTGPSFGFKFQF